MDARIGEVWAELGLDPALLDQEVGSLSGGEAARCGLAALLLSRFDVYLLDEPTNDLDLDSLDRLERWISRLDAAVVLVSHDRRSWPTS
ncbi:MAG: ATP-binding cassette domain-containing protein [Ilumatobacteraceae bacterium]